MSDYVSGEKSDYKKGAINRMLLNFALLEEAVNEPAILYKWDLQLAIDCLSEEEHQAAYTVIAYGERAFQDAVSVGEWDKILTRLHHILNVEGLVRKDNRAERELFTDKGRPFSPLEMARMRGEVSE